ncbi:MAG: winged helix-turn-helix domain-containing protein [Pyrinomonadaceae bacterium]|nr:winged helix-turn-helix domain-containing protein [Pyrinomonadaceae bacterium]
MSLSRTELYCFDDFVLDIEDRSLTRNGEAIPLSEKAFDTLAVLVRRANRLVEREELMAEIWPDSFVEENNLDKSISHLRKVFQRHAGERKYIETVRGRGFRFVADVSETAGEAPERTSVPEKHPETAPERSPVAAVTSAGGKWRAAVFAGAAVAIAVFFGIFLYQRGGVDASGKRGALQRIAVLPFKPLAVADRNEALELGMTDALIDRLNFAEGLVVSPLSSVRRFASPEQDPVAAGRGLGVDSVLDGNVQIAGDRIRFSAKLIRVSDGRQIWAQRFDERFTDILSLQVRISERVADALEVKLASGGRKRYTENAEAYDLFLKARFLSQKASLPEIRTAIEYLKRALELDPNFSLAYVVLADSYRATVLIGDEPPSRAMPAAMAAARKAVELDDSLAEAHAVLGWLLFWYEWDWKASESELEKALTLQLNNSDAYQYYAHLLSNSGRHEEALINIEKALDLEPLNLRANSLKGIFLLNAGRLDEAESQFRRTLELEPNFRVSQMFLARTLGELKRYDEAIEIAEKARRNTAEASEPASLHAYLLAMSGKREEAAAILEDLRRDSEGKYVSPYGLAQVQLALGNRDAAFELLEKAFRDKDLKMVFLKVDPVWQPLRSEPGFTALLQKLNLD